MEEPKLISNDLDEIHINYCSDKLLIQNEFLDDNNNENKLKSIEQEQEQEPVKQPEEYIKVYYKVCTQNDPRPINQFDNGTCKLEFIWTYENFHKEYDWYNDDAEKRNKEIEEKNALEKAEWEKNKVVKEKLPELQQTPVNSPINSPILSNRKKPTKMSSDSESSSDSSTNKKVMNKKVMGKKSKKFNNYTSSDSDDSSSPRKVQTTKKPIGKKLNKFKQSSSDSDDSSSPHKIQKKPNIKKSTKKWANDSDSDN